MKALERSGAGQEEKHEEKASGNKRKKITSKKNILRREKVK
jgi:hypothetical protein